MNALPSLNIHKYEVDLKYLTASETQMQKKVVRFVAVRLLAGVEMLPLDWRCCGLSGFINSDSLWAPELSAGVTDG